MKSSQTVDSRRYIIAYQLRSNDEVPPDFGECGTMPDFESGLFLPRDDPDWFGRSSYPARVVALTPAGFMIVPHPSAKELAQYLDFERLCFIESGHILLRGWLRFVGRNFDRTLFYNTRGRRAVDGFMQRLRAHFLDRPTDSGDQTWIDLGEPLDLKFQYALSRELDPGEVVRATLFRPARQLSSRLLFLKRKRAAPADLIALSARRVLWITDRDRGWYAHYGSIARYAPYSRIAGIERVCDADQCSLKVVFHSCGQPWRIPVAEEHWDNAAWFETAIASTEPSGLPAAQPRL